MLENKLDGNKIKDAWITSFRQMAGGETERNWEKTSDHIFNKFSESSTSPKTLPLSYNPLNILLKLILSLLN